MTKAVFLSASVPDPREPHFIADADAIDVTAAVKAFVYTVLGRRHLVWGGHPAITPMVWAIADSMKVDYGDWVTLYQSRFFEDEYPEDNEKFHNVIYTDAVDQAAGLSESDRRNRSLLHMRERMFHEHEFETAVFIGGMQGIVEEFDLFGELNPHAKRIPIFSTGGATCLLATRLGETDLDLERLRIDVDYVPLFHDLCGISPREAREQPLS